MKSRLILALSRLNKLTNALMSSLTVAMTITHSERLPLAVWCIMNLQCLALLKAQSLSIFKFTKMKSSR